MAETVNLKEFKAKAWINDKWNKTKAAAKATVTWATENPVLAIAIGGMGTKCVTSVCRAYRDHNEMVRQERRFYDRRKGKYSEARRNLKNWEKAEIDERYSNGESYQQILMNMGLLK